MKLYLVEDDAVIADTLCQYLQSWGHEIKLVSDFARVDEEVREYKADLILMDLSLPSYNGFYWCQKIRDFSQVPILILSSHSQDMDIVQGMQMGADDYLIKPVSLEVVRAKVDALLRRSYAYSRPGQELLLGRVSLDKEEARLHFEGKSLDLTKTELLILEALFLREGKVISRQSLIDHCWQSDQFIDDNTLAVNISRLRKKLREIDLSELIETKKGIGYSLRVI